MCRTKRTSPHLTCRELAGQQRALVTLEMSLEQLRLAKHNLLWDCKVQGLDLCLLSGDPLQVTERTCSYVCV